jgi:geranylgeranyl diphosphate synthase type I
MRLDSRLDDYIKERIQRTDEFIINRIEDLDGEVSEACLHIHRAGGKRLRPLVFLCSAEIFGKSYEDVVPTAAGIESLHTASLIQDDLPLMDDDDTRRGVETVHRVFGSDVALLSSNVLQSKCVRWSLDSNLDNETHNRVSKILDRTIGDICSGQVQDMSLESSTVTTEDEYLDMVSMKTASLYESASRLGSVVGTTSNNQETLISSFGRNLGIAFQMIDDYIDFIRETGKDRFTDLDNSKVTIVTLHGLQNGVPVFNDEYTNKKKLEMLEETGSIQYAKDKAQNHIQIARNSLSEIEAENENSKEVLESVLEFTLERTH